MSNKNPLASIVTVCYNGTPWLKPHLESVLAQTYAPLEYILVNNGSTDNMDDLVACYREQLDKKLDKFVYLRLAKNECVTGGLDAGLKHIRGKYFTWPNADDILYPDSIAKRVAFMEAHSALGLCYAEVDAVHEGHLDEVTGVLKRTPPAGQDRLFADLILEKNVFFTAIGTFARTSAFDAVNPSRTLPHNEIGENYQMLLPLAYRYPCGYLQAKSGKYVIRKNSESHSGNALIFHNKIEQILQGTLQRMDLPAQERKYWQRRVKYKYFKKKIKVYLKQLLLGLPIDYRKIRNYFK